MPVSFWIFLIVCVASFVVVLDDHGEAWEEFSQAKGWKRLWKGIKVLTIWAVALGSLVGTLVLGYESWQDNNKEKGIDSAYQQVTNDQGAAKKLLVETKERTEPRELKITQTAISDFTNELAMVTKIPIRVIVGYADPETLNFAEQIQNLLIIAGYNSSSNDIERLDETIYPRRIPETSDTDDLILLIYGTDNYSQSNVIKSENIMARFEGSKKILKYDGNDQFTIGIALIMAMHDMRFRVGIQFSTNYVQSGEFAVFVPTRNY